MFGFEDTDLHNPQTATAAMVLVFISGLLTVIMVANYVVGLKWNTSYVAAVLRLHIPESGVTMLIGMLLGALVKACRGNAEEYTFSPTLFFIGLLPPIIWNEAYHLNRGFFYAYLGSTLLFAVVGCLGAALTTAGMLWVLTKRGYMDVDFDFAELTAFSSLISATDPVAVLAIFAELRVHPPLFYLVFGESMLNDAVALVMFSISSKFVHHEEHGLPHVLAGVLEFCVIFLGSLALGVLFGWATAWVLKHTKLADHPILEIGVYTSQVYMPYLFAQVVGLSGICTLLMAGITTRHYAHDNLSSPRVQELSDFLFRLLAFLADNVVFMYLGMCVYGLGGDSAQSFHPAFIGWALLVCLASRAVMVFSVSGFINLMSRWTSAEPIRWQTQVVLWFSGLRGAVALAAASDFPGDERKRSIVLYTTMSIIVAFTFLAAPCTMPLIKALQVPVHVNHDHYTPPKPAPVVKWCMDRVRGRLAPFLLIKCRRCGALSCRMEHEPWPLKDTGSAEPTPRRGSDPGPTFMALIESNAASADGQKDGISGGAAPLKSSTRAAQGLQGSRPQSAAGVSHASQLLQHPTPRARLNTAPSLGASLRVTPQGPPRRMGDATPPFMAPAGWRRKARRVSSGRIHAPLLKKQFTTYDFGRAVTPAPLELSESLLHTPASQEELLPLSTFNTTYGALSGLDPLAVQFRAPHDSTPAAV